MDNGILRPKTRMEVDAFKAAYLKAEREGRAQEFADATLHASQIAYLNERDGRNISKELQQP